MSRYIDADAVKELIRSGVSVDTYADQDYVCELVDEIPTIDAVEVVRCKDCKWRKACKMFSQQQITDDSYCSWGESEGE